MKLLSALALMASVALATDTELRGLLDAGKLRRAQSVAERRLAANPGNPEALYATAFIKYTAGDVEGALAPAEKASELQPNEPEYHNLLAQIYGVQAMKASVFRQLGLARKCRKELDATLALDSKHYDARIMLMVYLLKAPGIIGGDKERARAIPDEILKDNAADGYLAKIRLLQEEDSNADLTDLYRKAAEADPKNRRAQLSYLRALLRSGKNLEEAERRAKVFIAQFPDRFEGYTVLAARHALGDRWTEMDAALAEARRNCPDNLHPFFNTALTLLKRGQQLQRAESYLANYLTREPEYGMPARADAHRLLGLILERQGRNAEAIAQFEAALRLKPHFEDAKNDLKRLRK